jgi:hypothetical protein
VRKPNPLLRFIPVLNFTSAASAFAVIALLFAGLLPGIAPAAAPAPDATSAASMEMASSAPQEPGTVILWNGVPSGGGAANDIAMGKGGGGGGSGSGFVLPPQVVQNITAEPGATSKLAPETAGAPESADNAAPQTSDPTQPQVMAAAPAEPLTGSGPILGAVPPEVARTTNQSNVEAYSAPVERESAPPVSRWWLAPAIALGVVALVSALGAQWLRRKTRA